MKRDPYKHKEKYHNWKLRVRNGIPDISKTNSDIIIRYLEDMEVGRNVSSRSTKGPRSYIRLNTLRQKMVFFAKRFKVELGLDDITKDTEEYRKTFTTSMEEFKRYLKNPSLKGQEPKIWSENRHCGSNFFRRKQFDLVRGYCEEFINWGCEDSDLQWKFKEIFNLEFFPEGNERMDW